MMTNPAWGGADVANASALFYFANKSMRKQIENQYKTFAVHFLSKKSFQKPTLFGIVI